MHTPGLTTDGTFDPQALTAALVEIHQCVTAHLLAERLADGVAGQAAGRVATRGGLSPFSG